jgi:hypothetical protein
VTLQNIFSIIGGYCQQKVLSLQCYQRPIWLKNIPAGNGTDA